MRHFAHGQFESQRDLVWLGECQARHSFVPAPDSFEPRQAITAAMQRTVELWDEHGLVMRTAIDLSLTVPEIGELWIHTADLFITAITAVLERAGVQAGTEPEQASAMAHALCWMIERTFYHASQESHEKLQKASSTCEHIWLTSAGLTT